MKKGDSVMAMRWNFAHAAWIRCTVELISGNGRSLALIPDRGLGILILMQPDELPVDIVEIEDGHTFYQDIFTEFFWEVKTE